MKKAQEKRARKATEEEREKKRSRQQKVFLAGKGATVLTETQELDSSSYRPKTRQSRVAYEEILFTMAAALGDQPQDVLRGAADEVLAILKVGLEGRGGPCHSQLNCNL